VKKSRLHRKRKKASKKGSDKPAKKSSEKEPEKKSSGKGKKEKKEKKNKKQKEEPIEEEPAAEEAEAAVEEEAAPEAATEEEDAPAEEEADDNMTLDDLGLDDDDDDEETKKLFAGKKEMIGEIRNRQAANAGKAKSNLTLDIKPYDTDTDMAQLEAKIRAIEIEGCKWLGGTLLDVAYGIKKLRIMCQLVDVLVNPDTVREEVEKFSDEVQSTDIFAFQMA